MHGCPETEHSRFKHGLHGAGLYNKETCSPDGAVRLGSVAPNIPTVGLPRPAETCIKPESLHNVS